MELRYGEVESAFDYFASTRGYLRRHGKPVAFYSDKHSIFRVNHEGSTGRARGVTQFGRALTELNIEIICATFAAGKGPRRADEQDAAGPAGQGNSPSPRLHDGSRDPPPAPL